MSKVKSVTITAEQFGEICLIKTQETGNALMELLSDLFGDKDREYDPNSTESNIILDVMSTIRKRGGVERD